MSCKHCKNVVIYTNNMGSIYKTNNLQANSFEPVGITYKYGILKWLDTVMTVYF